MKNKIKISLHPVFTIISSIYLLIFLSFGIKSIKSIIKTYNDFDLTGVIISVIALAFLLYLVLIRYREIEVYEDKYLLKSLVSSKIIYFHEINSVKKVPLNLFHLRLGSVGLMGVISLTSKPELYNVSDFANTIRISLKNDEIIHVSCDKPDEIIKYLAN